MEAINTNTLFCKVRLPVNKMQNGATANKGENPARQFGRAAERSGEIGFAPPPQFNAL